MEVVVEVEVMMGRPRHPHPHTTIVSFCKRGDNKDKDDNKDTQQ